MFSTNSREENLGFISTGTRQYRAGKSGREILSIRKCAMNQRNKRERAKGHVLQWFVVCGGGRTEK